MWWGNCENYQRSYHSHGHSPGHKCAAESHAAQPALWCEGTRAGHVACQPALKAGLPRGQQQQQHPPPPCPITSITTTRSHSHFRAGNLLGGAALALVGHRHAGRVGEAHVCVRLVVSATHRGKSAHKSGKEVGGRVGEGWKCPIQRPRGHCKQCPTTTLAPKTTQMSQRQTVRYAALWLNRARRPSKQENWKTNGAVVASGRWLGSSMGLTWWGRPQAATRLQKENQRTPPGTPLERHLPWPRTRCHT